MMHFEQSIFVSSSQYCLAPSSVFAPIDHQRVPFGVVLPEETSSYILYAKISKYHFC